MINYIKKIRVVNANPNRKHTQLTIYIKKSETQLFIQGQR